MEMEVIHDEKQCIFYTEADGFRAYANYRRTDAVLDILHTVVPKEIGGRGIASLLVRSAYDYARQHGLRPVATCSYAVVWLQRHPEYVEE